MHAEREIAEAFETLAESIIFEHDRIDYLIDAEARLALLRVGNCIKDVARRLRAKEQSGNE